jgi:hypothetical protein
MWFEWFVMKLFNRSSIDYESPSLPPQEYGQLTSRIGLQKYLLRTKKEKNNIYISVLQK